MLGHWARLRGKGGWARYYYPAGQQGPREPDDQWEPKEPPDEAYGRVTNPERFEPLHSAIMEMIARMEETFDARRVEGYGLDEELGREKGHCASVRPAHPGKLQCRANHSRVFRLPRAFRPPWTVGHRALSLLWLRRLRRIRSR